MSINQNHVVKSDSEIYPQEQYRSFSKRPIAKTKIVMFGDAILKKRVTSSGKSGRVYLPSSWVGHQVKVIRID